jgi:hypothetical protein
MVMILGGGIVRNKSIENFLLGYIIKRENKYFVCNVREMSTSRT